MASKKPVRRKPESERREAVTKMLTTDAELEAFQATADAAGMSLSTWLRSIAITAVKAAKVVKEPQ